MLKRFYLLTLVLLCSIVTAWAEDVSYSPTLEVNFRTASGNTQWNGGYPKSAADEGNTTFEVNYFAGLFALQKYTIPNLQDVTKLVLTLYAGSGTDAICVWSFPNKSWSAASSVDDMVNWATQTVGFAPRATAGTANTPLVTKGTWGSNELNPRPATFTISGTALATLKANASTDGTFTLMFTDGALTSNSSRRYLSTNSANDEANRPKLVATVAAAESFAVTNTTTGVGYKTLNEAINAVTADADIVLNDNSNITARCTLSGAYTVNVTAAKDVVLTGPKNAMWFLASKSGAKLNIGDENHTITLDGRSEANEQVASVAKYENSAEVSLTNVKFQNFKLTANGTTIPGLTDTHNSNGVITLKNITVSNCSAADGGALFMKTRVTNDRLVLKGFLNIDSDCTGTAIYAASETKDSGTTGRIKVDDSDFTASNTITIEWPGTKANGIVVVIGTTAANASKFVLTDADWPLERKSNGDLFMSQPTVKIGDVSYANIATAVEAVEEGGAATISLLGDQEISARVDVSKRNITVAAGGNTIKRATGYKGIMFLTKDKDATITIENATIDGQNVEATSPIIEASNSGTTVLKNVAVKNCKNVSTATNNQVAIIVNKGSGKLTLDGVTFTDCTASNGMLFVGTNNATIKGAVTIPSIYLEKDFALNEDNATASSKITLTTESTRHYGLLVGFGNADNYNITTGNRLSVHYGGIYVMPAEQTVSYSHPALLHNSADITTAAGRLETAPYSAAYAQLESVSGGSAAGAVETLKRMDQTNWSGTYSDYSNFTNAVTDAKLAYELALRYKLKGSDAAATAAVAILNNWATTCKGIFTLGGYANNIPDPNEYLINIQGHQFANAAELLRDYSGWQAADQQKFKTWMKQVFAENAIMFLENHGSNKLSHYWANWDLAALTSLLSVGVLCDDKALVDYALNYAQNGAGMGSAQNATTADHQDAESGETLAQCQESGRDQGHATLDVTLLGVLCQTAQNIGTDLWTPYKALEMAEYVGKYNLKNSDGSFAYDNVPFTAYDNGEYQHSAISEAARGTERPCWELFHAYAKANNKSDKYTEAWVRYLRAKNAYGEAESTSNDELGFGTLMFGAEVSADGIEAIRATEGAEGTAVVYDLQGRRVENPQKGVYIVNGKKVVIR